MFILWGDGGINLTLCCHCSVAKLCPTLCDPMDCSMAGFPVLSYLLEFAQIHVHWISDLCHLILCRPFSFCLPSFPASGSFPVSQLFTSGGQITRASASVLPINIQGWFPLGLTILISLLSKGSLKMFSSTKIRKHQLLGTQPSFLILS